MDVVRYALLGLGPGAVYATSALGLVVVHRGSGVLNFAHGAVGAVAALWFFVLRDDWAWPTPLALGAALGLAAVWGAAIHLVRSEERRVGKECVSRSRSWGWPYS